jgi:hypothetical protein
VSSSVAKELRLDWYLLVLVPPTLKPGKFLLPFLPLSLPPLLYHINPFFIYLFNYLINKLNRADASTGYVDECDPNWAAATAPQGLFGLEGALWNGMLYPFRNMQVEKREKKKKREKGGGREKGEKEDN